MNQPPTPEIRVIFTGPRGAGKTTAISTIRSESETPRHASEASVQPQGVHRGSGYDVGTLTLEDGGRVQLFGVPSEAGMRVLSDTLASAPIGVVLLLDATQPDVLSQLDRYLDMLSEIGRQGALLIGLCRAHQPRSLPVAAIQRRLDGRPWPLPIISVDVRERADVLLLIDIIRSIHKADAMVLAEAE
jgi:uncharacterized protein